MLSISTNSNTLRYQSDLCVHVKLTQTDINNEHRASHHMSVKHISIDSFTPCSPGSSVSFTGRKLSQVIDNARTEYQTLKYKFKMDKQHNNYHITIDH